MDGSPAGSRTDPGRRRWLVGAAELGLGLGLGLGATGSVSAAAAASAAARAPLRLTADFEPARAVWLGYAHGHDGVTAGLAAALKPHARLKYMLRQPEDAARLRELLEGHGVATDDIEFVFDPSAGYFLRDLVVFARSRAGGLGVVDFRSTLYGTRTWCLRRHVDSAVAAAHCIAQGEDIASGRNRVDRAIASHLGARVHGTALSMEGGGVETNGQGLLIACAPLWQSRNPGLGLAQLERGMRALPGVRRVIWLPHGLAEDVHLRGTITGDYVAWGAGGHTDQFVRFADERTVLLAWPDDAQAAAHPVAALTRRQMQRNFEILAAASDLRGRRLRVVKVPMPQMVQREVTLREGADTAWSHEWTAQFFPRAEGREEGQTLWQVATATYLNFVVANGALVLPDYLPHGTPPERQDEVRRIFESVFGGRRATFVDAMTANWVGGGLHCATANEPTSAG